MALKKRCKQLVRQKCLQQIVYGDLSRFLQASELVGIKEQTVLSGRDPSDKKTVRHADVEDAQTMGNRAAEIAKILQAAKGTEVFSKQNLCGKVSKYLACQMRSDQRQ